MKIINRILNFRLYGLLATITLVIFFYKEFNNYAEIPLIGLTLILIFELILLLVRTTWWNNQKYIFASTVIFITALIVNYGYGTQSAALLWPFVWILGSLEKKFDRLSMILAAAAIVIILLMSYPSNFTFGTLFALIGIFLGIRSNRIRQEAFKMSQLHLKELNEAHKELEEAHKRLLEASAQSMRYAALAERTRLAREIHDGIGHQLTSLIVQLQALELMLPSDPDNATELVSQSLLISRRAMTEVRIAVKEWSDDEMGLGLIALRGLVSQMQAQSAIRFSFTEDSEITEWSIDTSIVLYKILQESLTNILRHSNAEAVEIHLSEANEWIKLSISDDGQYLGNEPLTPGFGMQGIMERCQSLGGTYTIIPETPHGLRIEVVLPNEPA